MVHAVRDEVGVPLFGDLPADATAELKAVCWVFDYVVDFDGQKARLVPRMQSSDDADADPPPIRSVDEEVRQVWRDLLELVQTAPARARIAHALFHCGGSAGLENARTAITNYITAAEHWNRPYDSDEYMRITARLARITGDTPTSELAMGRLLDGAEQALANEPSDKPGFVLRPLGYVVNEPNCPARTDDLLDQAAVKLASPGDRDRALKLIFQRCTNEECRNHVWQRRVENYLTTAETESGIRQLILRHDALKVADASTLSELKERAAAALQASRHADLEMVRVGTSAAMYQELFDQTPDQMSSGTTWQEALLSFARCVKRPGNPGGS
jgi:hypothetical protein